VWHCHNCPVYTAAGRGLFERAVPEAYRQEWTDVLAREKDIGAADTLSVFVFRLGAEWLALPTQVCQEVTERCVVRQLPHRSDAILLGLVNIRGEIRLCISLSGLLGLEADDEARPQTGYRAYQWLVVIARDAAVWVFPVDEVYGLHPCHPGALQGVPVTVAKAPAASADNW
jgi:chemotaxis-related protein WspD